MAKATSKKQNNRVDPLAKKDGKKAGKEAKSSKDPKQSHLCKYSPRHQMTASLASPHNLSIKISGTGREHVLACQATFSRPSHLTVQKGY